MTTDTRDRPGPELPVVELAAADLDDILELDSAAFGFDPPRDFLDEVVTPVLELDRFVGARDPDLGGVLVATGCIFSKLMTFPGGAIQPAAGVSWVGVRPGWRRRGLLRGIITKQLHDLHDQRREAVAILTASEAALYGRFGYGMAVGRGRLDLAQGARLRPGIATDAVHEVAATVARPQVTALYQRAAGLHPGFLQRPDAVWRAQFSDHPEGRDGASKNRFALHPDGFVRYRIKSGWDDRGPSSQLLLGEICALTPRASASLWQYLLAMDLVRSIRYRHLWLDDPLPDLLLDVRAAQITIADHIWLRIVDLDRAIPLRTYRTPVSTVVDVADADCPWNAGRWRLSLGPDAAEAVRTDDPADIALDIADLGACLLGGSSLARLAEAGLVAGAASAVADLDLALSTPLAPWCPESF